MSSDATRPNTQTADTKEAPWLSNTKRRWLLVVAVAVVVVVTLLGYTGHLCRDEIATAGMQAKVQVCGPAPAADMAPLWIILFLLFLPDLPFSDVTLGNFLSFRVKEQQARAKTAELEAEVVEDEASIDRPIDRDALNAAAGATRPGPRAAKPPAAADAARQQSELIALWERIQALLDDAPGPGRPAFRRRSSYFTNLKEEDRPAVRSWQLANGSVIQSIRTIRNKVAHAQPIGTDEVAVAIDAGEKILAALQTAAPYLSIGPGYSLI